MSKEDMMGLPAGSVVKSLPANAGDAGFDSLVQEHSTCHWAAKAVAHNY